MPSVVPGPWGFSTPSPVVTDPQGDQEDLSGMCGSASGGTSLAQVELVCQPDQSFHRPPLENSPGVGLSQPGGFLHPEPQWLKLIFWHLRGTS